MFGGHQDPDHGVLDGISSDRSDVHSRRSAPERDQLLSIFNYHLVQVPGYPILWCVEVRKAYSTDIRIRAAMEWEFSLLQKLYSPRPHL